MALANSTSSFYRDLPGAVICSGSKNTTQRLCFCLNPKNPPVIGNGLSSGTIYPEETPIFAHVVAQDDDGENYYLMTHFWVTASDSVLDDAIFRYYVDGEEDASIEFIPSLACGTGFFDATAPWGTCHSIALRNPTEEQHRMKCVMTSVKQESNGSGRALPMALGFSTFRACSLNIANVSTAHLCP